MGGEILDPLRIIAGLRARGAQFVLTGDLAAMAHGAESAPALVEFCVDEQNGIAGRLVTLLTPLGAELVGPHVDPRRVRCRTSAGELECVELPAEIYRGIWDRASQVSFGRGVVARVAAPEDLALLRITSSDLVGAVRAGGLARLSPPAASPVEVVRGRRRHVEARPQPEDDEYGPEPAPQGLGPIRRVGRAFQAIDRFMSELSGGSDVR